MELFGTGSFAQDALHLNPHPEFCPIATRNPYLNGHLKSGLR
jgi:hypothetical protein